VGELLIRETNKKGFAVRMNERRRI